MQANPAVLKRGLARARHFYVQRISGFAAPETPFLEQEGIQWLRTRLSAAQLFLEFGSGGSTLLANQLKVHSVSVESDPYYAAAVRKALPNPLLATVVTPPMGVTVEWGMPLIGRRRKGLRYVTAPFGHLSGAPDLVLVDGRYRAACALESARRLNAAACHATMFFDDYGDRPYYRKVEEFLGTPSVVGRAAIFEIGGSTVPEKAVRALAEDPR